jgi:hypothetical protein
LSDPSTVIADDGTSITVVVPDGVETGVITVTTPGGSVQTDVFTVDAIPTITGLSAASGKVGSTLTISGTNLASATTVSFDGDGSGDPVTADLTLSSVHITDTTIQVVVPVGATSGTITVTTTGGVATSEGQFEVLVPPTVSSLSAASGKVGAKIDVLGTNLAGATVRIKGVVAVVAGNSTDTVLHVTVPNVALGATTILVTTPGGTASKSFTVQTSAPIITSFTQSASKKRGVGTVIVVGKNLTGATIKVGNLKATVRAGGTDTRLIFVIPAKAVVAAKGSFTITTAKGTVKSKATLKITAK